jgi:hypothetical protein
VRVAGLQPHQDGRKDCRCFKQHLPIVEAHHFKASLLKCSSPPAVLFRSFRLEVLPTVEFDDQAIFKASEIGKVGSDRVLPAELEAAELAVTQMAPNQSF